MSDCELYCQQETCDTIGPSGSDIWVEEDDCDVRLDIRAKQSKSTVIWGYVSGFRDCPLEDLTVTLFRFRNGGRLEFICHTRTDSNGYYQFELPFESRGKYRIVASKSACPTRRKTNDSGGCNQYREREYDGGRDRSQDRKQNNVCYY